MDLFLKLQINSITSLCSVTSVNKDETHLVPVFLGFLQRAADLLHVPAEELQTCLTVRTLKAGKQNVLKPCSQAECSVRRDCLAKVIYAQ